MLTLRALSLGTRHLCIIGSQIVQIIFRICSANLEFSVVLPCTRSKLCLHQKHYLYILTSIFEYSILLSLLLFIFCKYRTPRKRVSKLKNIPFTVCIFLQSNGAEREGTMGYLLHQSPKFYDNVFLFVRLTFLGTLVNFDLVGSLLVEYTKFN